MHSSVSKTNVGRESRMKMIASYLNVSAQPVPLISLSFLSLLPCHTQCSARGRWRTCRLFRFTARSIMRQTIEREISCCRLDLSLCTNLRGDDPAIQPCRLPKRHCLPSQWQLEHLLRTRNRNQMFKFLPSVISQIRGGLRG